MTRVVSIDVGCQPSPSGSGELIIQSEDSTIVVFVAVDTMLSERGFLEDKGIAVVRCVGCNQTRHGYPNDEGRPEHPLWHVGLSETEGIAEVENSSWVSEVSKQQELARRRLWGEHAQATAAKDTKLKHFIFKFKESTFECLALDLSVSLHTESYEEAVRQAVSLVSNASAT